MKSFYTEFCTYHHSIETSAGPTRGSLEALGSCELVLEVGLRLGSTGGEGRAIVEALDSRGRGGQGQDRRNSVHGDYVTGLSLLRRYEVSRMLLGCNVDEDVVLCWINKNKIGILSAFLFSEAIEIPTGVNTQVGRHRLSLGRLQVIQPSKRV